MINSGKNEYLRNKNPTQIPIFWPIGHLQPASMTSKMTATKIYDFM